MPARTRADSRPAAAGATVPGPDTRPRESRRGGRAYRRIAAGAWGEPATSSPAAAGHHALRVPRENAALATRTRPRVPATAHSASHSTSPGRHETPRNDAAEACRARTAER